MDDGGARPVAEGRAAGVVTGLTIFLGAFLLFELQPILGRWILPWFGGGPQVWTTCLLLFQTLLLGGYGLAHLLARRLGPRDQAVLYVALLVAAIAVLPIVPAADLRPTGADAPLGRIVLLVLRTVGLPFAVLAAAGPLLQSWYARGGRSPYRFFALSNAGSLLALLGYPLLVEPLVGRRAQAELWGGTFVVFAGLAAAAAALFARRAVGTRPATGPDVGAPRRAPGDARGPSAPAGSAGPPMAGGADDERQTGTIAHAHAHAHEEAEVDGVTEVLWVALAATGTLLLMSETAALTRDLAVVPLLWILPLALYLLSFVLCFDRPRWYVRPLFAAAFPVLVGAALWLEYGLRSPSGWTIVAVDAGVVLCGCMLCHGELARRKPAPARATRFYLLVAAGGALGGLLAAVVAPLLLRTRFELPLALAGAGFAAMLAVDGTTIVGRVVRLAAFCAALTAIGLGAVDEVGGTRDVAAARSFHGVLVVRDLDAGDPVRHRRVLQHGGTIHGMQFLASGRESEPAGYYGPRSGVGLAVLHLPRSAPRRIGVIGLGTGTMAAWARAGDVVRFYEIDPLVEELARAHFSYLRRTPARIEVALGDARTSLEREAPRHFDLLVLDAFTAGAVPTHLLTVEAFAVYLRHLRADGVLALHVSNRHLDLASLALAAGARLGVRGCTIHTGTDEATCRPSSDWVLLSRDASWVRRRPDVWVACGRTEPRGDVEAWTDDRASVLDVLR